MEHFGAKVTNNRESAKAASCKPKAESKYKYSFALRASRKYRIQPKAAVFNYHIIELSH
jgi:hypothetical protein